MFASSTHTRVVTAASIALMVFSAFGCAHVPTWDMDKRTDLERRVRLADSNLIAVVPLGWNTHSRSFCFNRTCVGFSPLRPSGNTYSPSAMLNATAFSNSDKSKTLDSYVAELMKTYGSTGFILVTPSPVSLAHASGFMLSAVIDAPIMDTGLKNIEARQHYIFQLDGYLIDCAIQSSELVTGKLEDALQSFCNSIAVDSDLFPPPNQALHRDAELH